MNSDSVEVFSKRYTPEYWEKLLAFSRKAYPRRDPERYRLYADYVLNVLPEDKTVPHRHLIIVNPEDEIVGLNMYLPCRLWNGVRERKSCWSFETKVLDDYRKTDAGMLIFSDSIAVKSRCGLGLSAIAQAATKIKEKFGTRWCAKLRLAVKLNVLGLLKKKFFGKRPPTDAFPARAGDFSRIEGVRELRIGNEGYWNKIPDVMEFCRDHGFLERRFLKNPVKHALYKYNGNCRENTPYFAVRAANIRGFVWLLVVDYRLDFSDDEIFRKIVTAATGICKKSGFAGVAIASSIPRLTEQLKARHFLIKKDSPADFVSSGVLESPLEKMTFFVTSADSDNDFGWNRN